MDKQAVPDYFAFLDVTRYVGRDVRRHTDFDCYVVYDFHRALYLVRTKSPLRGQVG